MRTTDLPNSAPVKSQVKNTTVEIVLDHDLKPSPTRPLKYTPVEIISADDCVLKEDSPKRQHNLIVGAICKPLEFLQKYLSHYKIEQIDSDELDKTIDFCQEKKRLILDDMLEKELKAKEDKIDELLRMETQKKKEELQAALEEKLQKMKQEMEEEIAKVQLEFAAKKDLEKAKLLEEHKALKLKSIAKTCVSGASSCASPSE